MVRVFMTLLVRDEEDVIVANLRHHLAAGVEHVIVTDNLSEDRTPDLLAPFEQAGLVTVIHETADDYDQATWVTRMARLAAERGADWVINNDADEFWWPTRGDLVTTFAGVPDDVDVVVAHRHDFVPLDVDRPDPLAHMTLRRTRSVNLRGDPLPPKVAHRAHPTVEVAQGNHRVSAPDLGGEIDDGRLEILHFPLRTYAQFERKIALGGRAYTRNPNTRAGWTWRQLYEQYQQGTLRDHWDSQRLDRTEEAALEQGLVVHDTRLQRRLTHLGGTRSTGPVRLVRRLDPASEARRRRRLRSLRLRAAWALRRSLGTARHVALVNYPDIENVGDPALWLGTLRALRAIGVRVVHHTSAATLDTAALRRLDRCDAILVNGGGNFGDLWPGQQEARERLLTDIPDIPVVQLPQSMHFTDPGNLSRMQDRLDRPGRTTLLWRESRSLAQGTASLPGRHRACPDLAFWLPRLEPADPQVEVLWLARTDKEAAHPPPRTLPPTVRVQDWTVPSPTDARAVARVRERVAELGFGHADASPELEDALVELARLRLARGRRVLDQGAVVVTDRLHGHVLATLMGLPHVVLDNSYGKVHAVVEAATEGLADVHTATTADEALQLAERIARTSAEWEVRP